MSPRTAHRAAAEAAGMDRVAPRLRPQADATRRPPRGRAPGSGEAAGPGPHVVQLRLTKRTKLCSLRLENGTFLLNADP
jgi:hypothetical protein